MDIELFLEFTMVAKHGNLSSAARELHVTQPALSRHLAQLEKLFDVTLFDRSTSPMELTPEGETFLHWASLITNTYKKMLDDMANLHGKRSCFLVVGGMYSDPCASAFKEACKKNKDQNHLFSVKFISESGQTPFDMIRAGRLDCTIEPFSDMIDVHSLDSVQLGLEPAYVVMDRRNLLAEKSAISIEDLSKGKFVSLRTNRDHANRKHLQSICRHNGLPGDVPGSLELMNCETYDEMLFSGLGDSLIMIPKATAISLCTQHDSEVVAVPMQGADCDYDIRLFYAKDPSPSLKKVLKLLE